MHELSVTQSILEIALRHAERANAKRITRLNLVIGELSGIVGESVQFYWDMIAKDTIAEGAELHFDHVPASLRCLNCEHTFPIDGRSYDCPACGESRVVAAGGDDFRLDSIEVE
jgi:hydrogenase nickel incorporation protein HypA/HybF